MQQQTEDSSSLSQRNSGGILWALGLGHRGFAADARGPFGLGPGRGILAGRQAGGVSIQRPDRQANLYYERRI